MPDSQNKSTVFGVLRSTFEEFEERSLAPYAVKSKNSQGRAYAETDAPTRTCFQRDRDRIIHSKSFRRLKHKTQVFVATEGDHYRSRLTHSLEVAQISRHIARMLQLNEDLCEAIALAHDLGHTPFGHSGERELNTIMKPWGGFEHNLQSRRIVDKLEKKYPMFPGLNLSFEVREGLIKHQTPWDHPEESSGFISLEAEVCNISDEIAYNNHDIDDGLSSGILSETELTKNVTLWESAKKIVRAQYPKLGDNELKYLINSHLISTQIEDVVKTTVRNLENQNIHSLEDVQQSKKPIVSFGPSMKKENHQLRRYLFDHFYCDEAIYRMNKSGQNIIRHLFEAFQSDHKLLPRHIKESIAHSSESERVIADYIAGMTDTFAKREHQSLF